MASRSDDGILRIDREDLDLEMDVSPTVERTPLGASIERDLGDRPMPASPGRAVCQVGSSGPAFVDIFIEFDAFEEAWRHGRSTTAREVAGVLLGGVWRDRGRPYVHITRALDARFTHERQSRVTFTHQTWHDLATRMDALGTDEVMVGWYHTHPGYSVFMSAYDRFIHRHFFTPYGVALVIDPLAGDCGFFEAADGGVERVPGFKIAAGPGSEHRIQAFMTDLTAARRPLPLVTAPPAEVDIGALEADSEFQRAQEAFRTFVRRLFGDLAPEPDAFSADVADASLTLVVHGSRLPPADILRAIDRAVFDVSRDNRRCRGVAVRVRRAQADGELLCTAQWYHSSPGSAQAAAQRGQSLDIRHQVLTPRMGALVTWHVPLDRLDIRA